MPSEQHWDYEGVVAYIQRRGYTKVALQFPDHLLQYAQTVYHELVARLSAAALTVQVYLLADTTFNSLAVDEVAAAHVQAHCIIHYGHASLNPVSRIPVYFVLPQWSIDTHALLQRIHDRCQTQPASERRRLLVLFDLAYIHARSSLAEALQHEAVTLAEVPALELDPPTTGQAGHGGAPSNAACCSAASRSAQEVVRPRAAPALPSAAPANDQPSRPTSPASAPGPDPDVAALSIASDRRPETRNAHAASCSCCSEEVPSTSSPRRPVGGLIWDIPENDRDVEWLWVGPRNGSAALQQLLMTYSDRAWCFYDPEHDVWSDGVPAEINRRLMRRYYLVEKTRDAAILGILVGTLSMTGYMSALRAVRELAAQAGKKTYTMLMGKPNPAKLANFPEVEVWVQIADSHDLIVDCKEYFAPIITPYEAYLALTDQEWDATSYSMDITVLLECFRTKSFDETRPGTAGHVDGDTDAYQQEAALVEAQPGARELAVQADRALTLAKTASDKDKALMQVGNASEYLTLKRTYQGLECPLVGSEAKDVQKAVEGRAGRAAGYSGEPRKDATQ